MALTDQDHDRPEGVELPEPTGAPMLVALGVTLLFAGLVTNVIVTLVGIPLVLFGGFGWWRGVFPRQREVLVPLQPATKGPPPIVPAAHKVAHLVPGEEGHRVRIPVEIHPYSAGVAGGVAGGIAMALVAMAFGFYAENSIWYPVNLLASVMLPSLDASNLAQLTQFHWTALFAALFMHALLSLMVGVVYGTLLPMLPRRPLLWAGIFAPLFWSGAIWVTLSVVSPALDQHINWVWFIGSQFAFGLVAGGVISRAEPVKTMQSWSLAERAGIEATGLERRTEDPS
ncbi:MAG: hypothetical protein VX574_08770 [Myxococcota bacterium]|nr:hypothetical protein [Myxococcota bacterium]